MKKIKYLIFIIFLAFIFCTDTKAAECNLYLRGFGLDDDPNIKQLIKLFLVSDDPTAETKFKYGDIDVNNLRLHMVIDGNKISSADLNSTYSGKKWTLTNIIYEEWVPFSEDKTQSVRIINSEKIKITENQCPNFVVFKIQGAPNGNGGSTIFTSLYETYYKDEFPVIESSYLDKPIEEDITHFILFGVSDENCAKMYYNETHPGVDVLKKYSNLFGDNNTLTNISSYDIANYLKNYNYDVNQVENDLKKLNEYEISSDFNNMKNCMNRYYKTTKDSMEGIKKYTNSYWAKQSGNFYADKITEIKNLLNAFKEELKNNSSIYDEASKETNFLQEFSKKQDGCNKIPDTTANRECIKMELRKAILNVNCDDLWNKNEKKLTDVEKYVKSYVENGKKNVSSKGEKVVLIKACKDLTPEIVEKANNIVDGTTKAQQDAKEKAQSLSSKLPSVIFQPDIEIKDDNAICNILTDIIKVTGIFDLIRVAGPILVIALTAFDGIRAFTSSKEEETKKFYDRLKIRLICIALLFLVPTIINLITELVYSDVCKGIK